MPWGIWPWRPTLSWKAADAARLQFTCGTVKALFQFADVSDATKQQLPFHHISWA